MTYFTRISFSIAAIFLAGNVFAASPAFDPPGFVTTSLTVSGVVEHKLILSVNDLKQFSDLQIKELQIIKQHGSDEGKPVKMKGVLLRDILEKAAIVSHHHNDVKKMAIIAIASDDYKVVFSWSEIFNSPIGDGVLVFFEKNGQELADEQGRIAMISTKDIFTGPRHVKWLKEIEVRRIVE